ncbi:MAG: hypothetical protein NC916_02805, partial [Candidatus Omnitrophica bacterium]|nr:hypothetical protein [Candidatus Omnitrophota bacterium]
DKTALGTGMGTITYVQNGVMVTQQIAAPDLNIPNRTKENFLNALTRFRHVLNTTSPDFSTIYSDLEDEFTETDPDPTDDNVPVLVRLKAEIENIDNFKLALQQFYNNIEFTVYGRATYGDENCNPSWPLNGKMDGGVEYKWAATDCPLEDVNGDGIVPDYDTDGNPIYVKCHIARVETGHWRFPYLKETHDESWGGLVEEDCVVLKREEDENNTWVRITRIDPGEKNIVSSGNLGLLWNPGKDRVRIQRTSRASWSYDKKVALAGIRF